MARKKKKGKKMKGLIKAFKKLFCCFNQASTAAEEEAYEEIGSPLDICPHYAPVDVTPRLYIDVHLPQVEAETISLSSERMSFSKVMSSPSESYDGTDSLKSEESQSIELGCIDINFCTYEIVKRLGKGGCGTVYEGLRQPDGLKVAVKFASKENIEYMQVENYPDPIPNEIGLLILANEAPRIPHTIELLDWEDQPEKYVIIQELPTPCEDLSNFLYCNGVLKEDVAATILSQTTSAAQSCCERGILHRDIKLENLLINPDTLQIKLIDFGCGERLTTSAYTSYAGTEDYCPPELNVKGEYHGKPATVWSLGVLLFTMLNFSFPDQIDRKFLNENVWRKQGLSQECCELLCALLQEDPEKRLELENVLLHNWFKLFSTDASTKNDEDEGTLYAE